MSKSKVTIYFFKNGQPFKPPHKVTIDRKKLEDNQVIERINRLHYYNGYVVYTLFGEVLRSVQEIHDDSAFVAVPRDQCFQPGPYVKLFRQYINEKLPAIKEDKKSNKKKKATTKPLGSSYGCKATTPRLAKEVRFCPGCRHVAIDTRCKDFAVKARRGKQDTCTCNRPDPHGECVPMPVRPKTRARRKKKGGWSSCCRKQQEKREPPVVRLRKRDMELMERNRAKKERRPKSKQGSTCCGKKPTREEQYKKQREKMIKQREKRIRQEEKQRLQQQRAAQAKIRRRRSRQRCLACCCPCCVKKPEPIWRQPTPHNCVEHLRQARDQAIRRRRALQLQEQTSWESITFPPKFKKKIRGTQTTKEDLKKARKASGKGWSCFGGKKKKEPEETGDPVC